MKRLSKPILLIITAIGLTIISTFAFMVKGAEVKSVNTESTRNITEINKTKYVITEAGNDMDEYGVTGTVTYVSDNQKSNELEDTIDALINLTKEGK